jgi:DNA modification methylase
MESNIADLLYLNPPWSSTSAFSNSSPKLHVDNAIDEYDDFIFKVIQQAHRILKPTGNLFIYSTPSMNVNFHNLIGPIFGSNNFRGEFIIPKKSFKNNIKGFVNNHETIIHYSKSNNFYFNSNVTMHKSDLEKLFPFEDSNNMFRLINLTLPTFNKNRSFEWKGYKLPPNRGWKYSKEKLNELFQQDKIFIKQDLLLPQLKEYLTDKTSKSLDSVWDDIPAYEKGDEFNSITQSKDIIKRIISISTSEGDLMVDPFCGSGITLFVADEIRRNWYGIDNTSGDIDLWKNRLQEYIKFPKYELLITENLIKEKIIWNQYKPLAESEEDIMLKRILNGENDRTEFKESLLWNHYCNRRDESLLKKIIIEIAAFMNSKLGGSLILGVSDNKSIIGLEIDYKEANSKKANSDGFNLYLNEKIKGMLGPNSANLYRLNHLKVNNKFICEIEINPSAKPIFIENEFYIRNGSQRIKLNTEEFYAYVADSKTLNDKTTT